MKLTVQALAKHRWPDKADHIIFDDVIPGFGLRARDGRRSWVFQYSIGAGAGRITRRIKIGDYPALPPGKAREEAEDLHAKVHLHGDPAIERRKNRIDAGKTFGRLVEQYLDFKQTQLRSRSFAEVRRHLLVNAKPLHNLPLASVDQAAIAGRLNAVSKVGAVQANRTRASLVGMFTWAMKEGLASSNPAAYTNQREERSRDRVLSDAELRAVWRALDDNDFSVIVKILILTGQRVSEIGELCWSEIDQDVIALLGSRTKNGRAHDVPITPTVCALLESRPRTGNRVFNISLSRRTKWIRALADRTGPIPHWTLHDLRRTAATGMASIGIQPHVVEACLNHVSGHKGGIAGVYNKHSYAKEKAEALARWDEHIGAVVKETPSKVAGLRGRR